ncbi:hypothetical protein DL98DRAFT_538574 [Cadophora sp. DSE1049]|nr:hypothetical protein DL98DRAFT_538574 [Cadophora sp. DSE1049]
MTSVDDISMFDSNIGLQPGSSRPLDHFEDYSFVFDPANTATSCSHRELQEVLNQGNPMTTMTSISKGRAERTQASQTTTASSYDNEIERLKRVVMELKREAEARVEKIEKLHEMFLSLVNTVAKQGVAIKQMIGDMSPDRSESFFRGFNEGLHKLPTNLRSKA